VIEDETPSSHVAGPVIRPGNQRLARWSASPVVAVVALGLWALLDAVEVSIAFSRQQLRMEVDSVGLQPGWLSLLGLAAAATLALAWRLGRLDGARLQPLAGLTTALWLLRLASLSDIAGIVAPWLSLLWAPHATWALWIAWTLALVARRSSGTTGRSPWRAAGLFAAVALPVYTLLALYTCQMTMLHSDEAHYLMVSQSLLRDGDIDIANNTSAADQAEYRVAPFDAHRAQTSPEGKIYSVHPVGVSVLMAPFYDLGLRLWAHPRLPIALLMVVLTVGWLALSLVWLVRLGVGQGVAVGTIAAVATTLPILLFGNQLYSETPTLLTMLLVLVATASVQTGSPVSPPGPWRPALHGGLGVLVSTLPFLHPRYAPLAGLLGLLLLVDAWQGGSRRSIAAVVGAGAAGLLAYIGYNLSISSDWMGHLRPGNAWDGDALQPGMWLSSLPGHWLQSAEGLLAVAPVYVVALVGAGRLAALRDRRLLVVVGIYGTTAVLNGLHPDWTFGFGPPTRFLMSAMPAILLLAAIGAEAVLRSVWSVFATALLLCLSWELIGPSLRIPELAYDGKHLTLRLSESYYPLSVHFPTDELLDVAAADVVQWAALLALPVAAGYLGRRRAVRVLVGLSVIALLAPALWGRTETAAQRLARKASPRLQTLAGDGSPGHWPIERQHPGLLTLRESTGEPRDEGGFVARVTRHAPGALATVHLPLQRPGVFTLRDPDFQRIPRQDGAPPDYAVLRSRQTLPAVQPWERREFLPLGPGAGGLTHTFLSDDAHFGYVAVLFSGVADLTLGSPSGTFHAVGVELQEAPLERVAYDGEVLPQAVVRTLDRGRYRLRVRLHGSALGTLVQRHPEPVQIAVFTTAVGGGAGLDGTLRQWLGEDRTRDEVVGAPASTRPVVERLQAPWWVDVPFIDDAYDVVFPLREARDVALIVRYDGPADLRLAELLLFQQTRER
jgi:hypothetical protein